MSNTLYIKVCPHCGFHNDEQALNCAGPNCGQPLFSVDAIPEDQVVGKQSANIAQITLYKVDALNGHQRTGESIEIPRQLGDFVIGRTVNGVVADVDLSPWAIPVDTELGKSYRISKRHAILSVYSDVVHITMESSRNSIAVIDPVLGLTEGIPGEVYKFQHGDIRYLGDPLRPADQGQGVAFEVEITS